MFTVIKYKRGGYDGGIMHPDVEQLRTVGFWTIEQAARYINKLTSHTRSGCWQYTDEKLVGAYRYTIYCTAFLKLINKLKATDL